MNVEKKKKTSWKDFVGTREGHLSRRRSGSCPHQQGRSIGALLPLSAENNEDGLDFPGRTRTKDKYRVVYSDQQRLELEKEFHFNRYITIRRKSEIANSLGLSERQANAVSVYDFNKEK
ncbi:unnamed protein product [Notodromas monacha]|uniref:Homeobox domain-containing protein n=1 Tax=Notodromas monacha TaxID=399045 RepID=A0A7R9GI78_9CRUS|nr:unnamed protein product [Notodromas monacha]CAG0921499.1 unnamed protein product [Notodromas monacha]